MKRFFLQELMPLKSTTKTIKMSNTLTKKSNIHQTFSFKEGNEIFLADPPKPYVLQGIRLGQSANLLYGLKAELNSKTPNASPFFEPTIKPLPLIDAVINPNATAYWQLPKITIHNDVNSLLSAVYPYTVNPLTGDLSTFSLPSGPLLVEDLNKSSVIAALSKYLGIDLTIPNSYMLVELNRSVGSASHNFTSGTGGNANEHLTSDALKEVNNLNKVATNGSKLNATSAKEFIKCFNAIGTHYVSEVFAGDKIFQVFAYNSSAFAELTKAFNASADGKEYVDGIEANSFQYYTTPANSSTGVELGYVSQLGSINIVSQDNLFQNSLKAGQWNDSSRAHGNSIFSAFNNPGKIQLTDFESVVAVSFKLTPLGNLIPVDDSEKGRTYWNRLFKGSMLQKYGNSIRVTYPSQNSYQWKNLLSNSGAWLSTIATPTVNVYDGHLALDKIQLTNRKIVKDFSSWSVVMESQKSVAKIPGEKVSLFSYLIDTTGPDAPPSIELSSKTAFTNLKMACGQMDGALTIGYANATEHKTIMDGIVLTSSASKEIDRSTITITSDLFGEQDPEVLADQSSNLNFSIVTCQTLLYSRGDTAKDAQDLAHNCLVWLTDIIPNSETISSELATVRLRAAYLAHIVGNLEEEGVTVPYLTYKSYENYIDAMSKAAGSLNATIYNYQNKIELQKNAELTAKTAEEINDNIKKSGNLLKEYIDAVAINQGDIAANYDNIINTKKRELKSTISNFSSLVKSVEEQKMAVRHAKQDFEKAMVDYETTLIIKAVIEISMAFMAVGSSIVVPSSSITALKSLGETAQKIQKILNVTTKIIDLEKTISKSLKDIVSVTNTLGQLTKVQIDMPSSLEWSEMSLNFDASLASAPSEVAGAKAKYVAAFKILVLRAQAMISAQSKIAQINAEIMLNEAQVKINQDQKERLNKITKGLNYGNTKKPDLSEIDLLSLTGHVQSQLNQVLGSLAQALVLQDSAVQFELLANPTPIKKFDLNSLHLVMVSQQANIINAKQAFNPPPFVVNDPIQYVIKSVPIKEFTKGNSYEFTIQPSTSEFQPYNMIRINQVVVDIPQIKGSENGKYRLDLSCLGNPFQDRNPSGEPMVFNTIARYFGPFEYQANNHKPIFGNETGAIAKDITHITPLSTWQVSMPDLAVNKNVDFGENEFVDIVISFRIEALAQNALSRFVALQGKNAKKMSHDELIDSMSLMSKRMQPQLMKSKAPQMKNALATQDATLQNMLEQMNKAQGVLKGWDCVLNMLEEPVNKFLAAQYKEKYPTQKPMVVEVGFCVPSPSPIPSFPGTIFNYTKFSVNLAQPLLEFQTNNHNYVKVTQLIQSGFIQSGSMFSPVENQPCPIPLNIENPDIKWSPKKNIDISKGPKLAGTVGLGMVQGVVDPILPDGSKGNKNDSHSVVLDFTKGSFVAENLDIDTDNATLNLQLSNWFINNPIQYLINTVVFNDATTLKSLQPTKFKLNVLTTNSLKNILQVFITTSGVQQSNLTINVNEPIPDGYHNSLMINTKIMFNNIFVDSFNKGTSNLQVASVDPKNDYTTWSAKVTEGTVSGEAKFTNTSDSETRINSSGNTITWPLKDLTFTPTINDGIQLTYNTSQNVGFQNRRHSCTSTEYGTYCSWSSWRDYSVDVDVKLTGYYPLEVINSGKKQEIQIASRPPVVTVTPPDLKPTGPCECNDNDLKIQVGNILEAQVPTKLQESMGGIKFSPISVFALYNLLFPTDDFIVMKSAYVPGDLVVLGTFNKYVEDDTK